MGFDLGGFAGGVVQGIQAGNQLQDSAVRRRAAEQNMEYNKWQQEQAKQELADQKEQEKFRLASQQIAEIRKNGNDPKMINAFMQEHADMFKDVFNEGDGGKKQFAGLIPVNDGRYAIGLQVTPTSGGQPYTAPLTQNRSTDPNDQVVALNPEDILGIAEYHLAGKYKNWLNDTQARKMIEEYDRDRAVNEVEARTKAYKGIYQLLKAGDIDGVKAIANKMYPKAGVVDFGMDKNQNIIGVNAKGEPAMGRDGVPIYFNLKMMQNAFENPKGGSLHNVSPGQTVIDAKGNPVYSAPSKPEKPELTPSQAYDQIRKVRESIAKMEKSGESDQLMQLVAQNMKTPVNLPSSGKVPEDVKKQFLDAANQQIAYLQKFTGGGETQPTATEPTKTVVVTGTDKTTGKKIIKYSDGTVDYAD